MTSIKDYDLIIIGGGSGLLLLEEALKHGIKTALVDKGPVGGTCLNNGCIPSKMIIYPADVISIIKDSEKLGIKAKIESIDFERIMSFAKEKVADESNELKQNLKRALKTDYYDTTGRFIDDYTLQVGKEVIRGKKILIVAGARPRIPKIKGLDKIDYLTNENVFDMKEKPAHLLIIGGGYVAAEFAHFFNSVGTKVTIVQHNEQLVPNEEAEVSHALKKSFEKDMKLYLKSEVTEIKREGKNFRILISNQGAKEEVVCDKILVAAGRTPNTDSLDVKKTGVDVDDKGYIVTNDYLETSKKNIWAFGDIMGKYMFRHSANMEASIALENVIHNRKVKMNYNAIPHAVFTNPQIASVGLTEVEARKKYEVIIGYSRYGDVARGQAMREKEGFAKAVIDHGTGNILGFHIVGPEASILIQEVVNLMANNQDMNHILGAIHIHPALSEVILSTLSHVRH